MTDENTTSEQPAVEEPVVPEVEVPKRYAYPHVALRGVGSKLRVYAGAPVELAADATMPDNSSGFAPQAAANNLVPYFDGVGWTLAPDVRKMSIDALRAILLAYENQQFMEAVEALNASYSPAEQQSWSQQITEAQGYLSGSVKSPVLLTALATARGVDLRTLAQKIVAKAAANQDSYATLLATHQVAKDDIVNAKTLDDLPPLDSIEILRSLM